MIILLHGEEEFTRSEALAALRREVVGDDDWGDLNLVTLHPPPDVGALRDHADTVPFLGDKRLVIVRGWLEALARDMARGHARAQETAQALAAYLPHVPDSTYVVFVEENTVPDTHPVMGALKELAAAGQGEIRLFALPQNARERREFVLRWLRDRARQLDIELDPEALSRLADTAGHDLRLLHQEMNKLRAYVGAGGFVTVEDVERLVPSVGEANIFHLVSAIGEGNVRRATIVLHQVLASGQHPLQILALLARQYRLYMGIKELAEGGSSPEEIARALRVPSWTVRRDLRIVRRLRWAFLKRVMERLLETDVRIKQGEIDPVIAIQLLVVRLAMASR